MAKIVTTSQAATGDPVEAVLDKNELKSISKVANDAVFSQESNWGLVSCIFKHKDSARRFVAAFKGSETEIMNLKPSMLAGDNFELKKIIVAKPNRELLVVNKPEIPSYADYDFTLKGSGTGTPLWDVFLSPDIASAGNGDLHRTGGASGWQYAAYRGQLVTGDFSFSGQVSTFSSDTLTIIGYNRNTPPTSLSYNDLINTGIVFQQNLIYAQAIKLAGIGDTSTAVSSTYVSAGTYSFSITRVSGVITAIFNDVTIFTDVNADPIYLVGVLYYPSNIINSATLVTAPAPAKNYIVWDNISGGAATDVNGKLYKGSNNGESRGISTIPVGTIAGSYDITFVMTNVNNHGVLAGFTNSQTGSAGFWVKLREGSLYFRDSNGADPFITNYNTVGDVTVKLVLSSQTIQIFLNNVEVLAPTALYGGFLPSDLLYPMAYVSPYNSFSSNPENDFIKESYLNV